MAHSTTTSAHTTLRTHMIQHYKLTRINTYLLNHKAVPIFQFSVRTLRELEHSVLWGRTFVILSHLAEPSVSKPLNPKPERLLTLSADQGESVRIWEFLMDILEE